MSKLLKIREVAERLGLSNNTTYMLAQRGQLPAFKVSGQWRIRPEALDAWIRDQSRNAEEGAGLETEPAEELLAKIKRG